MSLDAVRGPLYRRRFTSVVTVPELTFCESVVEVGHENPVVEGGGVAVGVAVAGAEPPPPPPPHAERASDQIAARAVSCKRRAVKNGASGLGRLP